MSIYGRILGEQEYLHKLVSCAILHSKGMRNVDIGRELDISAVKVTRYLQEARESGIIKIEVYPPPEAEIAKEIREVHGLREVYVFPIGIAGEVRSMLARLSAVYVEQLLDDKEENISSMALGPGRTMLAFVRALSHKTRSEMVVGSTSSATLTETFMASNILIGIVAEKWECELHRFDPETSLAKQKDYSDILILGVGKIPDMDGVTALALSSESGIHKARLDIELAKLRVRGGAGIINYQPIDEEGKPLDWDLDDYRETLGPTLLKLDVIREMAADEKKRVICISSGEDKINAIKAGLLGGYFNVMITDYNTAKALLEDENAISSRSGNMH